MKLPLLTD